MKISGKSGKLFHIAQVIVIKVQPNIATSKPNWIMFGSAKIVGVWCFVDPNI